MGLLDKLDGEEIKEETILATKKNDDKVNYLVFSFKDYLDEWDKNIIGDTIINYQELARIPENIFKDMYITSDDIKKFFEDIEMFRDHKMYQTHSDYFVSKIFKRAYGCGHNEFQIKQRFRSPNNVCSKIIGLGEIPLKLDFFSEVGDSCVTNLHNTQITFYEGAGENCAFGVYDSTIVFHKTAANRCGSYSHNSDIYFYGEIAEDCGEASENSRFYSPNEETLRKVALSWQSIEAYSSR